MYRDDLDQNMQPVGDDEGNYVDDVQDNGSDNDYGDVSERDHNYNDDIWQEGDHLKSD